MDELDPSQRSIVARLLAEGWVVRHRGQHDVYKHPDRPGRRIVVRRHRTLSIGVAREIAKVAGWR
jgi:predicted RNA binding protein YcfA (HicA-like mRNA interferase family)